MILDYFRFAPPRTGDLHQDVSALFTHFGCQTNTIHVEAVAKEAVRLAVQNHIDPDQAYTAGLLHDISAIIPREHYLLIAQESGVTVLAEEAPFPLIIHQKLSVVVAQELFGITDPEILSAIGCHTTLKPQASTLDKIVFLVDKLAWDQADRAPFLDDLLVALDQSLDCAVWTYLDYMWNHRDTMVVVHSWMVAAYRELSSVLGR